MRASVLVLLLGLVLMVSVSNGYVQERKDDPSIVLNEARADAIRDFVRRKRALSDTPKGWGDGEDGGGSATQELQM
ncbi:hypothetical protein LSAT2_001334 [Lamellibrachia satsuma]|nr:hypothetical protein LSAT2_001334 [Lamellibrachia satsuma]